MQLHMQHRIHSVPSRPSAMPGRRGTPIGGAMDGRPMQAFNGMSGSGLPPLEWRKSARSGPQGNCVEFGRLPGTDEVAVRNSRHPSGPVLLHPQQEIADLVQALKAGDFDQLL